MQKAASTNAQGPKKAMYSILELSRTPEPTSIHDAAERGNNMAIDKFLREGSTVDQKDNLGRTPIMWAIESGHLETVDFLIQRGAVLSIAQNEGRNVLHLAARAGATDIMAHLLETMSAYVKSKLLNQPDKLGITPVYLAYSTGAHTQACFELLLQAGANFDSLSTGRPPAPLTIGTIGGAVDLEAIKNALIRNASEPGSAPTSKKQIDESETDVDGSRKASESNLPIENGEQPGPGEQIPAS